ncbi:alpha-L-fucosidase [Verrucomicrobiota bacterium]
MPLLSKTQITLFICLLAACSFAAHKPPHDDGITEPYSPPKEQLAYLKKIKPEFLSTLQAPKKRIEEWQDYKFGVFMHWDPSCQMTGSTSWARKGRRPHHPSDGQVTRGIPTEVYDNLYKTFNPVKFNADFYARMVKDSGARYLVFTAKHHQGFCMFDSAVTDYDITTSPFKRDICKELADACHRHGVKLFWYYSQPDWHEPKYDVPFDSPEFERYRTDFLYPQMKELVTKYGRIDGIWWDGLGLHPNVWDSPKLLNMLRKIQPHLIFNHRCAPRHWRFADFDGPEGHIGRFQINRPWETCTKIGGGWGYAGDSRPLSLPNAVGLLVRCAGNGGNLLLNTGPAPDGTINPRHAERYLQIGAWLKLYGESIYSTRGGPYTPGPWGCSTRGKDNNTVYLHILGTWNGIITLPDLPAKIKNARVLTGGEASVKQENGKLIIALSNDKKNSKPADVVHEFDTIIALDLDRKAMDISVIPSIGKSLTIGATATASSANAKNTPASAVIASDATEFNEGTFIRSVWAPDSKDKEPWLEIAFKENKPVSQIRIQEGRYGGASFIESFDICLRVNGQWENVYEGTSIGNTFGLILPEAVTADAVRINFKGWDRKININMLNVY